jgi:hypothetical protein
MEARSITAKEPVFFEWADYEKKRHPYDKFVYICERYVERYGQPPRFCLLSIEDAALMTDHEVKGRVAGVRLMPRAYIKPGVFRLALPPPDVTEVM